MYFIYLLIDNLQLSSFEYMLNQHHFSVDDAD